MKKIIILLTIIFVLAVSIGVSAEKTFYWFDMMERPQLKYLPLHGMLSYYIQPVEFNNSLPVEDGYEQQLEITFSLSKAAEVTAYYYTTENTQVMSGTLKSKLIDNHNLILSVRGGIENYTYENPALGTDKLVADFAVISQLNVDRKLRLYNNGEIAITEVGITKKRMENGFIYSINTNNSLQGNLNSDFSNLPAIFSVEGAYRLIINPEMTFSLYGYKRFNHENLHIENVLQIKPVPTLTLKGNLIYNTIEATANHSMYRGSWIALKAEQAFTNFSVYADYAQELVNQGYGCLKLGINVKI